LSRHLIPALYQKEEQIFDLLLEKNLERIAKEIEDITSALVK